MKKESSESFFRRLTRIFRSGKIVKKKIQNGDTTVAVADRNKSSGMLLMQKSASSTYSTITGNAYNIVERLARYQDFAEMEYTPEIAAALDIYADETCAQDEKGKVLHVFSDNEKIKETLDEMFVNIDVDYRMRAWVRNLVKHGDFFMYNDIHPDVGVVGTFPIPVNEIEREENFDRQDPLALRFRWVTLGNRTLENWEISHFRLLGNDMFLPYGSSIIEPARRIWRQLILAEDAMLVYRIVRAPERRVFYIDVGNIPPENIKDYIEEQRQRLRMSSVIDSQTGRTDLRSSTMSVEEDMIIPVRGTDTGTKIDTLPGGQNTAAVEDVAYIQKKLFAAIKIPRAYLGYDESISSKATLAQEDIRFSRTIAVIQKTIISELNKLAMIHLFAKGFKHEELQNFQLRLSNPSTLAQQQKLELWRSKFELASAAPEGYMSKNYIRKEIWGLNNAQIAEIDEDRFKEKLIDNQIESASEEGDAGGGDDFGSDDLFGGGDNGAPEGEGVETPSEREGGDAGGDLFAGDDPLDKQPHLDLITNENDEIEIDIDKSLFEKDSPIKPKSFIEKYKYNRSRIKHNGSSKTGMPDFKRMLSTDIIDKDPYDKASLKSVISSPLGETRLHHEDKETYVTHLDITMKKMLAKMNEKFQNSKIANNKMILDNIDYVIDEDVDVINE